MKETKFDLSEMKKKIVLEKLNAILKELPPLSDEDKSVWDEILSEHELQGIKDLKERSRRREADMILLRKYPEQKRIRIRIESTQYSILPFKEPFALFCKRMKKLGV